VANTHGAAFDPRLDLGKVDVVVDKGIDRETDGYSGFAATSLADEPPRARREARVRVRPRDRLLRQGDGARRPGRRLRSGRDRRRVGGGQRRPADEQLAIDEFARGRRRASLTAPSCTAPLRTYGDSVVAVEPHGLDAIGAGERHGRASDLFRLWFAANAEDGDVRRRHPHDRAVRPRRSPARRSASCAATCSRTRWSACSLRGGPRFGLPQMVISRRAFGRDGNVVPACFAFLAGVGWFAIDSVFGAQALAALAHVAYPLALAVMLAAQIALAVYGYNAIHAFERYAGIVLAAGFHGNRGRDAGARAPRRAVRSTRPGGGRRRGRRHRVLGAIAFSYAVGWGPAASDYARYLPEGSSPRAVGAWAALGGFHPSTLLELPRRRGGDGGARAGYRRGDAGRHDRPSFFVPAGGPLRRSSACWTV